MSVNNPIEKKRSLCESIANSYISKWIGLINNIGEPFVYENISATGIRSLLRDARGYNVMAKKYDRLANSWRLYFTRTSKLERILNRV